MTIIFFFIITSIISYSQSISKQGGICFRIDDNHTMEKYNEYAEKFNKYNKNFCFALNLGRKEFDSSTAVQNKMRSLSTHTNWTDLSQQ